jgi:hypothetical protein
MQPVNDVVNVFPSGAAVKKVTILKLASGLRRAQCENTHGPYCMCKPPQGLGKQLHRGPRFLRIPNHTPAIENFDVQRRMKSSTSSEAEELTPTALQGMIF